jgi:hypothetical protein
MSKTAGFAFRHTRRHRVELGNGSCDSSGNFATLAAIRRASSFV